MHLAGARLCLYYGLFCALVLAAGLQLRTQREAGAGSGAPLLGVTVDLARDAPAARQELLTRLRLNGFGWVRQRFDWAELEPQPGQFDWRLADNLIADIVDAGLEPVVLLDGSPAWARAAQDRPPNDNPLAPPADPATFARFAAAFAARYGGKVEHYQIWDEPNLAPHWGNRLIEPVAYAQLLKAASQAIRQADPGAVILTAALAPTADRGHTAIDEGYFLQRMLAAGAGPFFDVVAVQPFGFGHDAGHARQSRTVLDFQRAAWIRRVLVDAGLADKPIWAIRYGWNRLANPTWGAVTPEVQAREAVAALDIAWREWPWLAAMGWAAARPAAAPEDPIWGFALWDAHGDPTPVLEGIRTWKAATATAARPAGQPRTGDFVPCLLLAGAMVLSGWRMWAAARLLPWLAWLASFRRSSWLWQAAAWSALLAVYYFAVWPPLVGLCWIIWALLCLARPAVGLGVAAMLLPFYFQHKELYLVDATVTVAPAVAATFCLTPALLWRAWRKPLPFARQDWAVIALLAVSLLAAAGVWQWAAYGRGLVELVVVPILLWLAVRCLAPTAGERQWLALALFAGGLLVALWGLAGWLQGTGVQVDGVQRLVGPHFSPNHSALYLVRTFFVGLGLMLAFTHRVRWAMRAAALLVLLALLLTVSRGALLLGLPSGAAAFAWLLLRRSPGGPPARPAQRKRTAAWLAAGGSLLLVAAGVWLWERLRNLQTVTLRLDLWEATLHLWRDHLWSGVGPGGFFWHYPAYLTPGAVLEPNQLHPHNIWLELGATWGIGGLLWLGLLLYTLHDPHDRALRLPPPAHWIRVGALAGLIAAVAHAQVDAFFLLTDLAGWNAMALAIVVAPFARANQKRGSHAAAPLSATQR